MEFAAKMLKQLAGVELSISDLRVLEKIGTGFSYDRIAKAFTALTQKSISEDDVRKAVAAIRLSREKTVPIEDFFKKTPQWTDRFYRDYLLGSGKDDKIVCMINGA